MVASKSNEVIFQPVGWSASVERHISKAPNVDPIIDPDTHFKKQVEAGKLMVIGAFISRQSVLVHIGSIVCGIYEAEKGKEVVMHVVGGDEPGHDLTVKGLSAVELIAKENGCKVVRFDTVRPGIVAKADKLGYGADGVVMRKVLDV